MASTDPRWAQYDRAMLVGGVCSLVAGGGALLPVFVGAAGLAVYVVVLPTFVVGILQMTKARRINRAIAASSHT